MPDNSGSLNSFQGTRCMNLQKFSFSQLIFRPLEIVEYQILLSSRVDLSQYSQYFVFYFFFCFCRLFTFEMYVDSMFFHDVSHSRRFKCSRKISERLLTFSQFRTLFIVVSLLLMLSNVVRVVLPSFTPIFSVVESVYYVYYV